MPTPLMRSLAKKSGKKVKTIENLWDKTVDVVKAEYNMEDNDDRFYPLVVGMLKRLLRLQKKDFKPLNEDGEGDGGGVSPNGAAGITTDTYGSNDGEGAEFYGRIGTPAPTALNSNPFLSKPDFEKYTKKKRKEPKSEKELADIIKNIVKAINDPSYQDRKKPTMSLLFHEAIELFERGDADEHLEEAILFCGRYTGVVKGII
jgi:hypothetical protein